MALWSLRQVRPLRTFFELKKDPAPPPPAPNTAGGVKKSHGLYVTVLTYDVGTILGGESCNAG